MTKAFELLEALDALNTENPIDPEAIKKEFKKKLDQFGILGVDVTRVTPDSNNNILVTFKSGDDEVNANFNYSGGSTGFTVSLLDTESPELPVIDLSPLNPSVVHTGTCHYVSLRDLSWMTKSTLVTLLTYGGVGTPAVAVRKPKLDAFGNVTQASESASYLVHVSGNTKSKNFLDHLKRNNGKYSDSTDKGILFVFPSESDASHFVSNLKHYERDAYADEPKLAEAHAVMGGKHRRIPIANSVKRMDLSYGHKMALSHLNKGTKIKGLNLSYRK